MSKKFLELNFFFFLILSRSVFFLFELLFFSPPLSLSHSILYPSSVNFLFGFLSHTHNHTLSSTLSPSSLLFLSPSPLPLCVVRWKCVFGVGGCLMSAWAMIRSEKLICCGSLPQRPISILPPTPRLPHIVRRHRHRHHTHLPPLVSPLTPFLHRQSFLPPHANN